jgi:lysozyme family protein
MYEQAFDKLIGHEGGYSNHPNDRGGETYMGIARVFFPYWAGWDLVDAYRKSDWFPGNLKNDEPLTRMVREFYKTEFWDKLKLDQFPEGFEGLQFEVFDTAVNMGKKRGGKLLQRALNILNRNEAIVDDLKVDGIVGSQTISVIDKYKYEAHYLFKLYVLIKAKIYVDILEGNHSQEAFARGWINRISLNP